MTCVTKCAVCHKVLPLTSSTPYDDFYGDLCQNCWNKKVLNATHNPWTGRPL